MVNMDEIEYEGSNVKIWANKVSDNLPIHADIATKEIGPFYCPDTFEELIVRHCIEKVNHFAYKALKPSHFEYTLKVDFFSLHIVLLMGAVKRRRSLSVTEPISKTGD